MRSVLTTLEFEELSREICSLFFSWRYPIATLCGDTGSAPVSRARRSTAPTCVTEGRFKTHSFLE
jgi:hypothetical protein